MREKCKGDQKKTSLEVGLVQLCHTGRGGGERKENCGGAAVVVVVVVVVARNRETKRRERGRKPEKVAPPSTFLCRSLSLDKSMIMTSLV